MPTLTLHNAISCAIFRHNLMKLHIILFTSSTNKSGGSRQALYLAEGMAARGHNVRLFVPGDSRLPELSPDSTFWRFLNKSGWRKQIEAAMPESGPCVVHAFHNAAVKRAAWWGLFWKKRAAVAAHRGVLYRPHNPLPYWSSGVDAFLVNSRECGRVLQTVGLSARRIRYVPNAVPDSRIIPAVPPHEFRASLNIPLSVPLFVSIANNSEIKGVREMILAFAEAFGAQGGSEAPFLVVAGVDVKRWSALAAEHGVGERVRCMGQTEDIGSLLAAGNVFVLPSLSESMPNTLLEAIRAGLPSIGTEVGAVPDILRPADGTSPCGLLVPPGDSGALAKAMSRLVADSGLRDTLTAGASVQAEAYRPEKRLNLVESIYLELLQTKGLL